MVIKTDFIITEKKRISDIITKAIAPEIFDERGDTKNLFTETLIFDIGTSKETYEHFNDSRAVIKEKNKVRNQNEAIISRVETYILDGIKRGFNNPHKLNSFLRNKYSFHFNNQDEKTDNPISLEIDNSLENLIKNEIILKKGESYSLIEGLKKIKNKLKIFEDANYYLFEKNGKLVFITDTMGNLFKFKTKGYEGSKSIFDNNSWKELKEHIDYEPSIESFNINDLKSRKARSYILKKTLAEKKLICDVGDIKAGSELEIERVIAATDFDIAGSYIFLSSIEAINNYAKKTGLKPINPGKLFRMKMTKNDPQTILNEYISPFEFDWENAYAGKARAYFDFLYGTTISEDLRYNINLLNEDKDKKKEVNVSIGRTIFLSLSRIIQQEILLKKEKNKKEVYMIFPGIQGLKDMQNSIKNKNYSLIVLNQKKDNVSKTKLMELCKEDNIGTHTTRFRLIKRLEDNGLINTTDTSIHSTEFGTFFYLFMNQYLNNDQFSIEEWNSDLYGIMDSWRIKDDFNIKFKKREEMEDQFNSFMNWFMPKLKMHLSSLNKNYAHIAKEITRAYQKLKRTEEIHFEEKENNEVSSDTSINLKGLESTLSDSQIKAIIDDKSNLPRVGNATIKRTNPISSFNIDEHIRRVCNIDYEYSFKLENITNKDFFYNLKNEEYTVFRTELPVGKKSLKIKIVQYISIDVGNNEFIKEKQESAHESLQMSNPQPSDMKGEKGLFLVEEYHKPWKINDDMVSIHQKGDKNVKKFKSDGLIFERVQKLEFGKVHNFESLLNSMMQKYKIPFSETARMAEDLYLGGK